MIEYNSKLLELIRKKFEINMQINGKVFFICTGSIVLLFLVLCFFLLGLVMGFPPIVAIIYSIGLLSLNFLGQFMMKKLVPGVYRLIFKGKQEKRANGDMEGK